VVVKKVTAPVARGKAAAVSVPKNVRAVASGPKGPPLATAAPRGAKPRAELKAPAVAAKETPIGLKGKMPKTLAAVGDLLYTKTQARLEAARELKKAEEEENFLKAYLIDNLGISETDGVVGKLARVTIESRVKPVAEDWPKIYAHIKKTGEFELLQHRLGEKAVEEHWSAKKTIPGVGRFNYKHVSVTKR
jgi:hypothetical protein